MDMMDTISKTLEFVYELYIVPDGKFGAIQEDETWNGIVGQVVGGVGYNQFGQNII